MMELKTNDGLFKIRKNHDGTFSIIIIDEGQWIEAELGYLDIEEVLKIGDLIKEITSKKE